MKFVTKSIESPPSDGLTRQIALGTVSDADLLDAWCRDQQRAALAALIDRYSRMVLSVCRRRCRTEADAEDAYQTTFLYLARNGHKIRQPERLVGWLHRVAQRSAVATLPSEKRQTDPMIEPAVEPDDPLDRLTQRHEAIVLDEELAELPEHYRAAIAMHLFDDCPLQMLADHFGTSIGSIRGRLQRGKQMLARRLRHRGIIPAFAFASASAWIVSTSQASVAASAMVEIANAPQLPNPPIEPRLLDSLLSQGTRLMPTLYTAAGVLAGSTLLTLAIMAGESPGQGATGKVEVNLPAGSSAPVAAQFGAAGGSGMGGGGLEAPQPSRPPSKDGMIWTQKTVPPPVTSRIALKLSETLDEEIDFKIHTALVALPEAISEAIGMPVLMDVRGVEFAEQDLANVDVDLEVSGMPLRTALRRLLSPYGLKAVIEDEGLMITADPSVLVHRGIGTDQWVNVDTEAEKKISEILNTKAEAEFIDLPMDEAVATLSEQHQVPILIDRRALEEIGITADQPVTLTLGNVKLRTLLRLMLRDLDLTYQVNGETLSVTTQEAAESNLVSRIYWLEGTGFAEGDFESVMNSIQTTIQPDTWELLGGPSTIVPVRSARPAILVSAVYRVHEEIEKFLKTLRQSHFGKDPVLENVQVPDQQGSGGGIGGGGQGGGGFF
ncbi:ECF RNA polymerase sigma factor SigR [Rubripirellula tenax]|uniref:ECF RNA polymerase sigma factor SigR n=1 Tax=Rubripirellula tenax TaxID=2528015 RepID=A0A5C6FHG2_9BACT|nr:sigma-70 family RNA polymerase sigma factor [Rubripirellula tenax]TWU59466.1 ECF RNA polymerase sigma factor SigR [Rubripirellula tenax]